MFLRVLPVAEPLYVGYVGCDLIDYGMLPIIPIADGERTSDLCTSIA